MDRQKLFLKTLTDLTCITCLTKLSSKRTECLPKHSDHHPHRPYKTTPAAWCLSNVSISFTSSGKLYLYISLLHFIRAGMSLSEIVVSADIEIYRGTDDENETKNDSTCMKQATPYERQCLGQVTARSLFV